VKLEPYLLFDAGGTLVFPDPTILIAEAWNHGIRLTHPQLWRGYYRLIYNLDHQARDHGAFPADPWPRGYAHALFETLGIRGPAAEAAARSVWARHALKNLWTFTFDWVEEALTRLAGQGVRMAVVSNSDGRTEEVLRDLGLARYFERIFDSKLLGLEKPDPAIFRHILAEVRQRPSDVLHVGDIYEVDVRGANRVGIPALHLDPLGLYTDWPGVHLPDVSYLPDWLRNYTLPTVKFDALPFTRPLKSALPTPTPVAVSLPVASQVEYLIVAES
jgi:putative hydrolase of the HAD superfamily